jgi:hypothetical protein
MALAPRIREHEAVELGLGQRIGAFLLDRVLRREHEERLGQRVVLAPDGDLVLLHRLEQRGLGLGRRAVDLVGQDDVGEDRARTNLNSRRPVAGLLEHLGAGDVAGHQVGRELDAVERQVEDPPASLISSVLARPGTPTSRQWPRQDQLDDLTLADHDLVQLGHHDVARVAELVEKLADPVAGRRHERDQSLRFRSLSRGRRHEMGRTSSVLGKPLRSDSDAFRNACIVVAPTRCIQGHRRSGTREITII